MVDNAFPDVRTVMFGFCCSCFLFVCFCLFSVSVKVFQSAYNFNLITPVLMTMTMFQDDVGIELVISLAVRCKPLG